MLSVLIVNWNTRDLLRACLFSLEHALVGVKHEVIVVDNASHDGSSAMVYAEFPSVRLFANARNLGYAAGNNQAFEAAGGEWIWLLNPDTEVLNDAAQKLIAFLEVHPQAGGVASMLVDARDGSPQRSCRRFPTPGALWAEASGLARCFPRSRRFGFYRMGDWNHRSTRQVEQPMASSFLLRREAIKKSGGLFDERFPIFFNDVDLCCRLIQHDWQIWYDAQSRVRHWGGAATRQIPSQMIRESHRSLRAFYQKHYWGRVHPLLYAATMALIWVSGWARVGCAKRNISSSLELEA